MQLISFEYFQASHSAVVEGEKLREGLKGIVVANEERDVGEEEEEEDSSQLGQKQLVRLTANTEI